jgi:HSP20 family molecular chaperone IbpA
MRTYDISPLWRRSTIGFDRFLDLVDAARHAAGDANYPPCNVERLSDDRYQISLALAGFSPDDITITAEQNVLSVEGRKADNEHRNSSIKGSRRGRSSGSSFWQPTSGSREHGSTTACSRSSWFERFRTP